MSCANAGSNDEVYLMEIKTIPEFPLYSASKCGLIYSNKTGLPIKQILRKDGYFQVQISVGKKRYSTQLVHRLVAFAHIKKIENKSFINHKNGDKADNKIDNLEWCTQGENIRHARDVLGVVYSSPKDLHPCWKTTPEDDRMIKDWYRAGILDQFQLAKFFNVHVTAIMDRLKMGRISGKKRHF